MKLIDQTVLDNLPLEEQAEVLWEATSEGHVVMWCRCIDSIAGSLLPGYRDALARGEKQEDLFKALPNTVRASFAASSVVVCS